MIKMILSAAVLGKRHFNTLGLDYTSVKYPGSQVLVYTISCNFTDKCLYFLFGHSIFCQFSGFATFQNSLMLSFVLGTVMDPDPYTERSANCLPATVIHRTTPIRTQKPKELTHIQRTTHTSSRSEAPQEPNKYIVLRRKQDPIKIKDQQIWIQNGLTCRGPRS